MRIRRVPFSLLLLAHAISLSTAETIPDNEVTRANSGLNDALSDNGVQVAPNVVPRGTVDAPVDGKDGKPHEGPFVETQAERDRRKAKDLGIEADSSGEDLEGVSKRLNRDKIPVSNNGVMDDRDRAVPKEGTRGTEGGISEKSSSSKMAEKVTPEKAAEYSTKVKNSEETSGKPIQV